MGKCSSRISVLQKKLLQQDNKISYIIEGQDSWQKIIGAFAHDAAEAIFQHAYNKRTSITLDGSYPELLKEQTLYYRNTRYERVLVF